MEEISKVQPGSKAASKTTSPAGAVDEQMLIDQLVDSSDAQPLIRWTPTKKYYLNSQKYGVLKKFDLKISKSKWSKVPKF